jgi:hypothetical protein
MFRWISPPASFLGETPRFSAPLSQGCWRLRLWPFCPTGANQPRFRWLYHPALPLMGAFLKLWPSCSFSCFSRLSWFLLPVPFLRPLVPRLSNQPVPADHESLFVETALPSLPGPDRGGVIEQPVLFLLLGQPGEPGMERVVGWQDGCRVGGQAVRPSWAGVAGSARGPCKRAGLRCDYG